MKKCRSAAARAKSISKSMRQSWQNRREAIMVQKKAVQEKNLKMYVRRQARQGRDVKTRFADLRGVVQAEVCKAAKDLILSLPID